MSKYKKLNKNEDRIVTYLKDAYDRAEGQYSNIPKCCIEDFIGGRTYNLFMQCLSEKDQKKLLKWEYVPCDKCFKNNKINKLKKNGTSMIGIQIGRLIEFIKLNGIK